MKIEKTLYIQAVKWEHYIEFKIEVTDRKQETSDYKIVVDVAETSFSIDLPDFDNSKFTLAHISQLQEVKLKVLAENQIRLQNVDDQIASLQAIENKV